MAKSGMLVKIDNTIHQLIDDSNPDTDKKSVSCLISLVIVLAIVSLTVYT